MTTIPKKTLRYTLLDVESNTQCGVTSHAFPPRWTNEDFFEYYNAGDVDGEEECVNDIWWVEQMNTQLKVLHSCS